MIKLENTEVIGWEHAIRGMRNPLNSWEKSDSEFIRDPDYGCSGNCPCEDIDGYCDCCFIGTNDLDLMKRLRNAGTDHRKFMRMITVYVDITAPLYWWKEFDTYKVGTVANSCSTMHKIAEKEFTLDDFSTEHVFRDNHMMVHSKDDFRFINNIQFFMWIIDFLNENRRLYIETKDKKYWWQMIQLLPTSYNQKRTVMLNYEVLANIYKSRRNHKLDEWKDLCKWIESLPYSELITGNHIEEKD